jgi:hypothetical protein
MFTKFAAFTALALTVIPAQAQERRVQELHMGNAMMDDILNSALAAHRRYYGVGDPRCPLVRTYGRYGGYTRTVHTCQLPPRISNGMIEMHSRRLIVGDEDRR